MCESKVLIVIPKEEIFDIFSVELPGSFGTDGKVVRNINYFLSNEDREKFIKIKNPEGKVEMKSLNHLAWKDDLTKQYFLISKYVDDYSIEREVVITTI